MQGFYLLDVVHEDAKCRKETDPVQAGEIYFVHEPNKAVKPVNLARRGNSWVDSGLLLGSSLVEKAV